MSISPEQAERLDRYACAALSALINKVPTSPGEAAMARMMPNRDPVAGHADTAWAYAIEMEKQRDSAIEIVEDNNEEAGR